MAVAPVEAPPQAAPAAAPATQDEASHLLARTWVTIVWDDPVNLMTYVAYVFRAYFGHSDTEAERLMLKVHNEGRAVVSSGSREDMERDVTAMHEFGLWATMQKDD